MRHPILFRWLHTPIMAVLVAALTTSCGIAYHTSSLVGAGRVDDHTMLAGPARVTLRFGAEWVELSVTNTGAEPIEVDWNAIEIAEAQGGVHHLRDLALLHAARGTHNYGRPTYAAPFYLASAHVRDELPHLAADREVIRPGASSMAVLYVAEHAWPGRDRMRAGPVFCHSPSLHAGQPHEVWLSVPVRLGGRSDTLRLTALIDS